MNRIKDKFESGCPICLHTGGTLFPIHDDRHGFNGRSSIRFCNNCKHTWAAVAPAANNIRELYTTWYPRSTFERGTWRPLIGPQGGIHSKSDDRAQAHYHVNRVGSVLDIGCGAGQGMAMLTSKGCNTQGVEADENAVNIAREHGLSVTNGVFNKEMFTDQRFDWILMDQVIEHLEDPIESLANCARILSPNGTIIVACPRAHSLTRNIFGRRWIHWHTPYHRHFFSRKSMEIAAAKASLKMQTHETNTKSNWVLYQMLHPILFGGHGRKSVMWDNRINRGIPAKIIQKSLTGAIKTLNLHKLLAHQISSSGRGDNSIFILRCI